MSISVLLVDDHAIFRKGLRMMLNEEEDIDVVGEAGDGEEAIRVAIELSPDVIVMDITMPNVDGIEATRRIVSKLPHVKVIPLSIHSGKRFVENMLRAGAAGYLLKESAPEELVGAIRSVHQGDICLSSEISGVVVSEYVRLLSQPNNGDELARCESAGCWTKVEALNWWDEHLSVDEAPQEALAETIFAAPDTEQGTAKVSEP